MPLLLLSLVAVAVEHARLEADLAQRASLALSEAGFAWATVSFSGRDGVLTGLAPQEGEPGKAAVLVSAIAGVRQVINRAGLIERAEHYQWWASRKKARVRLSGYVPTAAARQAILGVTKASFPGLEVVDRMTLARGVPSIDDWLGGISFALKQLAALKRGEVRLDGLNLAVSGEAEDGAAYRMLKADLRGGLPKGITLGADEVSAPVVSPYLWTAKLADGKLLLGGSVPGDGDRAELLAAARASAPGITLSDAMEPGGGAPQGFVAAAKASLRELPRLAGAQAALRDAYLAISGTASDAEAAEAVRSRLRAALPPGIVLRDEIAVRAPPSTPAAKETLSSAGAPRSEALPEKAAGEVKGAAAPPIAPGEGKGEAKGEALPTAKEEAPGTALAKREGQAEAKSEAKAEAKAEGKGEAKVERPGAGTGDARTLALPQQEPGKEATAAAPRVVGSGDPRSEACVHVLTDAAGAGAILFRLGSAELAPASHATLDRLAAALHSCPGVLIEVGGHASAEGGEGVNRRLSLRRAKTVVAYLVRAGVDAKQLEGVGFGATRPIAPNDSAEHMARNRRIEFTVRPK